tara:strand:- start:1270 stop:2724 length:1455 start_codon:yes stop_codon:yes gene_type:complete
MKILFFTGFSGFTQRTNNIAYLIKEKYPNFLISKLVYGKKNFQFLLKQTRVSYHKIECIEDIIQNIYSKNNVKFSDSRIKYLEEKVGVNLNYLAFAERTLVQHTHEQTYQKKLSQDEIVKHVCLMASFLEEYVKKNDVIIAYTCASLVSELLFYFSKYYKKKFLTFNETRLDYRWSILGNNMDQHDEISKYYRSKPISKEGRIIINKFIKDLKSNKKNSIEANYQKSIIDLKKLNIKNIVRFIRNLILNDKDNYHHLSPTRWQRIKINIIVRLRLLLENIYLENKLPKEKYAYYPLSLIPEASVLIRGQKYYDTLSIIKSISRELPLNYKLVVREHPSMAGKNSLKIYNQLKNIHNVHLMSYRYPSLECIKNAEAVITITGSTGLESISLGKKTLLLGKAIYSIIDSVFKINNFEEIYDVIRRPWKSSDKTRQINELYKFGSAVVSEYHFRDDEKSLWTTKAQTHDIIKIDRDIFKSLIRKILK